MVFELNFLKGGLSNDNIVAELKRVSSLIEGKSLTRSLFDKHSKISSCTIVRRFGSWNTALLAAGLSHKYCGRTISHKMLQQHGKHLTDNEIIAEIQRIASVLNKTFLTQVDISNHSKIISGGIVRKRFGSFAMGMKRAGVGVSSMYHKKLTDENCFENLLGVWTHYGRQPLYREMDIPPSIISAGTYDNHFGNWRNALEAFASRMNNEESSAADAASAEEQNQIDKEIVHETERKEGAITEMGTGRSVNLSLRYKVLKRDAFKCVKCGASPATNPIVQLHIDHIIPFSRGGITTFENLQTLCESCNLGKGNRHSD